MPPGLNAPFVIRFKTPEEYVRFDDHVNQVKTPMASSPLSSSQAVSKNYESKGTTGGDKRLTKRNQKQNVNQSVKRSDKRSDKCSDKRSDKCSDKRSDKRLTKRNNKHIVKRLTKRKLN